MGSLFHCFGPNSQVLMDISPEIYLIVVSLTALTVPATRHSFHHFLPLTRTARDTAYRCRERWVPCPPTHSLHLNNWKICIRIVRMGSVDFVRLCLKRNRIKLNLFVCSHGETKLPIFMRDNMEHQEWQPSAQADITVC